MSLQPVERPSDYYSGYTTFAPYMDYLEALVKERDALVAAQEQTIRTLFSENDEKRALLEGLAEKK